MPLCQNQRTNPGAASLADDAPDAAIAGRRAPCPHGGGQRHRTTTQRLSSKATIDQLTHGAQVMAAQRPTTSAAPRCPASTAPPTETGRAVRQMGLAASAVSDNPQLFIYGSGRLPPAPASPVCPALAHPDRQRHAPCTHPSHVLP